jgi:hypothetical protein
MGVQNNDTGRHLEKVVSVRVELKQALWSVFPFGDLR